MCCQKLLKHFNNWLMFFFTLIHRIIILFFLMFCWFNNSSKNYFNYLIKMFTHYWNQVWFKLKRRKSLKTIWAKYKTLKFRTCWSFDSLSSELAQNRNCRRRSIAYKCNINIKPVTYPKLWPSPKQIS